MKIALDAAKGLAFLHEEAEKPVIYRDFKTSNILLDGVRDPCCARRQLTISTNPLFNLFSKNCSFRNTMLSFLILD